MRLLDKLEYEILQCIHRLNNNNIFYHEFKKKIPPKNSNPSDTSFMQSLAVKSFKVGVKSLNKFYSSLVATPDYYLLNKSAVFNKNDKLPLNKTSISNNT